MARLAASTPIHVAKSRTIERICVFSFDEILWFLGRLTHARRDGCTSVRTPCAPGGLCDLHHNSQPAEYMPLLAPREKAEKRGDYGSHHGFHQDRKGHHAGQPEVRVAFEGPDEGPQAHR